MEANEEEGSVTQTVPMYTPTPVVEAGRLDKLLFQSTELEVSWLAPVTDAVRNVQLEVFVLGDKGAELVVRNPTQELARLVLSSLMNVHKDSGFVVEGKGPVQYSFCALSDDTTPVAKLVIEHDETHISAVKQRLGFEYVVSQYSRIVEAPTSISPQSAEPTPPADKGANFLATGIEDVGKGVAAALRFTSKGLGTGIRYAGGMYARNVTSEKREVEETQLRAAEEHRNTAKKIHSGAKYVSAAVMTPVRFVGKQVASWAQDQAVEGESQAPSGLTKSVVDTLSGLGNAITHVNKGLVDAVNEIGHATADAVMEYSVAHDGEEYAEQVTKLKLDAAGHIGKAAYCGYYVATLGGMDMAQALLLEGVDSAVNAADYMKGPILMQGWLMLSQPPFHTEYKLRFVVVRVWSISWYIVPQDMSEHAPERLLPTSNLRTHPYIDGEPPTLTISTLDNSPFYFRVLNKSQDETNSSQVEMRKLTVWRDLVAEAAARVETIRNQGPNPFTVEQEARLREMPKPLRYVLTVAAAKDMMRSSSVEREGAISVHVSALSIAGDKLECESHESAAVWGEQTIEWDPAEVLTVGQNACVSPATCQGLLVVVFKTRGNKKQEVGRRLLHLSPKSWDPSAGQPLVLQAGSRETLHEGWLALNSPPEKLSKLAEVHHLHITGEAVEVKKPQLLLLLEMHALSDFSLQQVGGPAASS